MRLTEISEGRYFCCALSPTCTPVEQRIGLKFQFLFAEGVLRELKTIEGNPDLFSEQPEPSQAGLAEPENSTIETYTVADFKRSVQGTRNAFRSCGRKRGSASWMAMVITSWLGRKSFGRSGPAVRPKVSISY